MNKKVGIIFGILLLGTLAFFLYPTSSNNIDKSHQGHDHSKESVYTCPMHPEIRENKPGSCPICHMKLVKVASKSSEKVKRNDQNNLDLDISPYQANLIGIKPTVVNFKMVTYKIPVSGRVTSNSSIALQVFEKDLRYIEHGVKFVGTSEIYPEEIIKGEITAVDNFADPSSRTIRVLGKVRNGGRNLPEETSFTGHVSINLNKKLVIPEKSVLFTGNGSFVYLYENETLRAQKVTLGPKVDEEYVVFGGIKEGDSISSGPNFLIDSESKIRGLSTSKSSPKCPDGQEWNTPMSMCMPESL